MTSKGRIYANYFDFPYDFDQESNLVQDCLQDISDYLPSKLRLDIYGSYPSTSVPQRSLKYLKSKVSDSGMIDWLGIQNGYRKPTNKLAKTLWWTFENRRPPSGVFDGTISFDIDSFSDSNFYLPLVYQYLDISGKKERYVRHRRTVQECMEQREINEDLINKKSGFVSIFMNNPHPMRIRVIEELKKIGNVSIYGRFNGRYIKDKIATAKQYKFNLCFENDLYPGYVTEKVLEAWLSESIPLYWGDDAAGVLNENAIVNLQNFSSTQSFLDYIVYLNDSPELMAKIIKQPLFAKNCDYSKLKNFILHSIS